MTQPFEPHAFAGKSRDYLERVSGALSTNSLWQTLGLKLHSAKPGDIVLVLTASPAVAGGPAQTFHVGAVATLADAAGALAALSLAEPEHAATTSGSQLSVARSAVGNRLIARGTVLRAGRSVTVARTTVSVETPEEGMQVCAVLQATYVMTSPV